MAWRTRREPNDATGNTDVFAILDDDPSTEVRVYEIDQTSEVVRFFPKDDFPVSEVRLEGFRKIPDEFSPLGYIKAVGSFISSRLGRYEIDSITISREGATSSFRKLPKVDRYRVVLAYKDFQRLKSGVTQIETEAKADKSNLVDEFFSSQFPSKFDPPVGASAKLRSRRILNSLDPTVIAELTASDIDQLLDFVAEILQTRYVRDASRRELFAATRLKINSATMSVLIEQFEQMLSDDPSEADWGRFLQANLYLVGSKYVGIIPELNVMLAGQRKADFGLVDADGFLDIYEIKKPSTPLLAKKVDRGNYYWSTEATKAIAQAEKYLYNAERKASSLVEDIRRERGIELAVVRPKAILLIGAKTQVAHSEAMQHDLRVLRDSLKNVEIVLFDELLDRLRNQMDKVYIDAEIDVQ